MIVCALSLNDKEISFASCHLGIQSKLMINKMRLFPRKMQVKILIILLLLFSLSNFLFVRNQRHIKSERATGEKVHFNEKETHFGPAFFAEREFYFFAPDRSHRQGDTEYSRRERKR